MTRRVSGRAAKAAGGWERANSPEAGRQPGGWQNDRREATLRKSDYFARRNERRIQINRVERNSAHELRTWIEKSEDWACREYRSSWRLGEAGDKLNGQSGKTPTRSSTDNERAMNNKGGKIGRNRKKQEPKEQRPDRTTSTRNKSWAQVQLDEARLVVWQQVILS